jgi:maltooligosyltrehalose trehalohydrolase
MTTMAATPMVLGERGWWNCELHAEQEGSDYAFSIDNDTPLPDPRSRWQPEGVHHFSRPLDHSSFEWRDAGWQPPPLSAAVIYECHIGTFTPYGTFESAIERLPYLKELGITHLELMPVAEFPGERGWGYDGVDLYAPHHSYGGPSGLKKLVDAAHREGLAILLDVVYNHLGPDGNYLTRFGPYNTDRYRTPWGQAVNLDDANSDEVRRFFCDNALMWLRDYHFDGLRLDAIHAIFDASAIHFLEQLQAEVEVLQAHLGRHLVLIAESDLNQPRVVTPRRSGGYGLAAQWNDDFHHAVHALLSGENAGYYADFGSIACLAKALSRVFVNDGCYSRFRRRVHGKRVGGLCASSFVGFIQNHDQVGNRPRGERLGHLIDDARLKIAAGLMLASPFVPMLFQGEEWNSSSPFLYFTDHTSKELGAAVTAGRRKEFAPFSCDASEVPDPQAIDTFIRSKLDWRELDQPKHRKVVEWYVALLKMRRALPDLTDPRMEQVSVTCDEVARWLCMRRGQTFVVCNFAERPQWIPLAADSGLLDVKLFSSSSPPTVNGGSVYLAPISIAIAGPRKSVA